MKCNGMKSLAAICMKFPESCSIQLQGFCENHIEHRREIAGRGIDDLQDLGGRGLPSQSLVPLGDYFVEPALQLREGGLRIGYAVIERRGHVLLPRALI